MLVLADGEVEAGAELELELLLLQAAMSSAAETAAAVRPALFADTEYNGVPRLFSRDMPTGHVRDQIRVSPASCSTGRFFSGIVGLRGETFQLTLL